MSTTKELKVRKGLPYNIKLRANGKYDYTTTHTFNMDNEQLSYEMQDYDGLRFTWNGNGDGVDIIDFSDTVLPWKFEMNNYLAHKRYCAKPYREEPYQVDIFKKNTQTLILSEHLQLPKMLYQDLVVVII